MRNFKIIFIIVLLFSFLKINNIYASNIEILKTIKINFKGQEKQIFSINKNIDKEKILNKFLACFDNKNKKRDDFQFIFKENWLNSETPWFWFIRNSENEEKIFCYMQTNTKNKLLRFEIQAKSKYKNILDISYKFYKKSIQRKQLSCESSATSDIISTIKNKNIDEDEIIERLEKSEPNAIAKEINNKKYWWNPDLWFVWYINEYNWRFALQSKYEWYWVYEKPISKVYDSYWIWNKIINKENRENYWLKNEKEQLTYLLKELNEWNYIQLWWDICTYPEFEDWKLKKIKRKITQEEADKWINWKNLCYNPYKERKLIWYYKNENWEEEKIIWLNWEHNFYLLWYKWWVENPTQIIIWDTTTWKHIYKTKEWMRKWWKMDYRSIVIYKKID